MSPARNRLNPCLRLSRVRPIGRAKPRAREHGQKGAHRAAERSRKLNVVWKPSARCNRRGRRSRYFPAVAPVPKLPGAAFGIPAAEAFSETSPVGAKRLSGAVPEVPPESLAEILARAESVGRLHALPGNFPLSGISPAPESAALAIKMGCDVNCGNTYLHLLRALEDGLITEDDITTAAERLFTTRFMLGEFDENCEYNSIPYEVVECPEHLALSEEAARRSVVLLKNDGILPLDKAKIKTIGVIGPNANDRMALIGNYHGTASRYITVLEGIQDYVGDDVRVLYAEGCHLYKDRVEGLGLPGDRLSEAETVAEHSDVVVLVTGLNENLEGEEMDQSNSVGSGDKANLLLPAPQRKLMEVVAKTGKPVILINMTGSAMDLRFAEENFSAVVQGWYPGARGGKAIAELLFGKYSFSGKLPVTFYNDSDELPAFTDYAMENRTYRYFTGGVLYPFGYGLTYGKTEVTKAEMRDDGEHYTITATVKNEGCAVHEILQIYVRDNESEFAVRNHSLCAFKPVSLGANETCDVEITVPKAALEIVDDTGTRRVDSRSFTFFVGTSQPDDRSAELLGTRPVAVELKL